MSIVYTYEIVSVDEVSRCMEVVYSAEGHQTMRIGARLPFEGEALDDVIKAFAPIQLWRELSIPVVAPVAGQSGSIDPLAPSRSTHRIETDAEKQDRLNAEMWAQVEFEKQVAKALVKFGVLQSDPTSIELTQL